MSYHAASNISGDSISDYNGFLPHLSCEVDRVHLTFLFKATFLIKLLFI